MIEEEEEVESDQSEVINPDMSDEEEQAKEGKLRKWKEHSWANHNLEDPDIPFVEDDEWLRIWFENRKKEKERVIMDECDYSQWIEEREDLDFICPDPYKIGESDFDEMEGERNDSLDGTSLASLFNQMEITNFLHNYTINKEDEEVIKAQTNTSIWGLLMSQRDSHHANFKDEFSSKALFGKEEGGK
ncbi:hypothetical protein RHMOL_Rhmol06G0110200 [Rhododendron molle]|uniref:Uncharacterized protein n=1 Tax=Rhododendron molle TaxID=49168 RepID=A0ACC0NCX8_RHOML|nr:hypothetical protein RHMOL_Rhmol06G0110200 [Rhododendron molle]